MTCSTIVYGSGLNVNGCVSLGNYGNYTFSGTATLVPVTFMGCAGLQLYLDGVSQGDGYIFYSDAHIVSTTCQTGYDYINGACVASATYSTPGKYTTLTDCNSACGGGTCPTGQTCFDPNHLPCPTCPTCPDCPTLPCASCPTGQTCKDSSGEEVNFVNISVPTFTGNCDDSGNPVFVNQSVAVIAGTESSELLKFQELAQIKGAAVCNIDAPACPDGWLIRPEYHRPQVIYQFAEVANTGKIVGAPKYKITVPHHVSDEPDDPLPNYKRGNWEIIYVLKDNSKVTIHSFDESNGMIMLNAIKLRIIPSYLVGAYLSKSSLVVTDTAIAEITVKNRMAKYYSTGTKNGLPDWIVKW